MTTAPAGRRHTLREDLLDDLRQGPDPRTAAMRPLPSTGAQAAVEPAPAVGPGSPALEVRITPRSWTRAGWVRRPGGDGVMISLGPVRLSLGDLRP